MVRRHAPLAILILAAALALPGCASLSSSSSAANPPTAAPPSASALAAPPSPAASPQDCTTHACIVQDMEKSLTGLIAQDESVATKVTCYRSTVVFHAAADTYSASCTVDFSDGTSAAGTGNLDLSQQKVTFQPAGT